MNIIVTGAGGFIGRHLVERLVLDGHRVVGVDLPGVDHTWFTDTVDAVWIEQDLSLVDTVWWANLVNTVGFEIDTIWHLASTVGVETVITQPETMIADLKLNTTLAEYLRSETKAINLGFTSTSEIYGERDILREDADMAFKSPEGYPRGIYASQKLTAEHLFLNTLPANIEVRILRLFSITGPRQSVDFVIPKMVAAAIAGTDITVYGDGSQSRVFMHVTDLVEIMIHLNLFDPLFTLDSRIMNVGNVWNYVTMHKLAHGIKNTLASTSNVVYVDGEIGETSRLPQLNNMMLLRKPEIPLRQIIVDIATEQNPTIVPDGIVITNTNVTSITEFDINLGVNITTYTITIDGTSEIGAEIAGFFPDGGMDSTTVDGAGLFSLVYNTTDPASGILIITGTLNAVEFDRKEVNIDLVTP